MRCALCRHAKRREIEQACESGREIADVANAFRVSEKSLTRHIGSHPRAPAPVAPPSPAEPERRRVPSIKVIPAFSVSSPRSSTDEYLDDEEEEPPATSRSEEIVSARARSARGELDELLASLRRIASSLPSDASVSDRVAVLRASLPPIKLLGQLTGEIGASETTVATSPHYRRIRAAITEALRPHPDALKDVIDALERVERGAPRETTEAAAE